MQVHFETAIRAKNILAQVAAPVSFTNGMLQAARRKPVFAAQEDVRDIGFNGERRDDHPFDQLMRITLQQQAVLECSRLHLVGITHNILGAWDIGTQGHEAPFGARGKTGAPAALQVCLLDHLLDVFGRKFERLWKRLVSAAALVRVDFHDFAVRSNPAG